MSSSLIRQDVLPVGVGYLLVMGALGTGLWLIRRQHGDATPTGSRQDREACVAAGPAGTAGAWPGWGRLIRHYLGTAIGGYVLLMAVVILYYYGVARVGSNFLDSAFTGSALLLGVAVPVFAAASVLSRRRGRNRRPRSGPVGANRGGADRGGS